MSELVQAAFLGSLGPVLIGIAAVTQATFAKREAAAANRAVNHKDEDQPTLYQHAATTAEALAAFTEYQHNRNHELMNQVVVVSGRLSLLDTKVERHTHDDASQFGAVLDRLDGIDGGITAAKTLAAEVKHDLAQFNEIDTLGREGRIDRRTE